MDTEAAAALIDAELGLSSPHRDEIAALEARLMWCNGPASQEDLMNLRARRTDVLMKLNALTTRAKGLKLEESIVDVLRASFGTIIEATKRCRVGDNHANGTRGDVILDVPLPAGGEARFNFEAKYRGGRGNRHREWLRCTDEGRVTRRAHAAVCVVSDKHTIDVDQQYGNTLLVMCGPSDWFDALAVAAGRIHEPRAIAHGEALARLLIAAEAVLARDVAPRMQLALRQSDYTALCQASKGTLLDAATRLRGLNTESEAALAASQRVVCFVETRVKKGTWPGGEWATTCNTIA